MKTPEVQKLLARGDGLAARLKRARETADLTQQAMADKPPWPFTKVSKIENGRQLPTDHDLELWAAMTSVGKNTLKQWQAMLVEAKQLQSSFDQRTKDGQAPQQSVYTRLVVRSSTFRFFEREWVPRFLQTPAYTRAVLALFQHYSNVNDIDDAVAERQASVGYLQDRSKTFELIIDEAVLRRWWPGTQIMTEQLERIRSCLTLPNVRLGIYPLQAVADRPPTASFTIFGDTAFTENAIDDVEYYRDEHVAILHRAMDSMWAAAVEGDQARDLIDGALQRSTLPT